MIVSWRFLFQTLAFYLLKHSTLRLKTFLSSSFLPHSHFVFPWRHPSDAESEKNAQLKNVHANRPTPELTAHSGQCD